MKRAFVLAVIAVLLTGCGTTHRVTRTTTRLTDDGPETTVVESIIVETIEVEEIEVENIKTYEASTTYWN